MFFVCLATAGSGGYVWRGSLDEVVRASHPRPRGKVKTWITKRKCGFPPLNIHSETLTETMDRLLLCRKSFQVPASHMMLKEQQMSIYILISWQTTASVESAVTITSNQLSHRARPYESLSHHPVSGSDTAEKLFYPSNPDPSWTNVGLFSLWSSFSSGRLFQSFIIRWGDPCCWMVKKRCDSSSS